MNVFNNKCYEEDDVSEKDSIEITIECTHTSQVGLLEFWIADDATKGVLDASSVDGGDNAIIPNCCMPGNVPKGTPVVKYGVEIKCVSECPEVNE